MPCKNSLPAAKAGSKDPVREAARKYKRLTPGSAAEEALVEQHLPLVRTVVGRLAMNLPSHVDGDDLYSSGLVGLLNAVRNFDPEGGSTFEAYARVRIRGAVFDELRRLDWVPRSVHDKARKVQAVILEIEQATGELASDEQVAKALKLSVSEYHELLEEIKPATFICLDASPGDDDDASRHESIADESQPDPMDCVSRREVAKLIARRMTQMPDMQRKVLALYYFEDMRLREIAEAFGVTESRICQIHSQAILSIKAFLAQQESAKKKHSLVPA